jgi:hypothetical protein
MSNCQRLSERYPPNVQILLHPYAQSIPVQPFPEFQALDLAPSQFTTSSAPLPLWYPLIIRWQRRGNALGYNEVEVPSNSQLCTRVSGLYVHWYPFLELTHGLELLEALVSKDCCQYRGESSQDVEKK